MEQLIELLRQIQELAGVGVQALTEAGGEAGAETPPGPTADGGPEGAGGRPDGPPQPGA